MNAVEIEEAVSKLAEQPFDPANFPYAFLEAFGNKPTTIQRLRSGSSNKSDIEGGILQHNNIHIAISTSGRVSELLTQLRTSPATSRQKAKFILATDGKEFQAEDLTSDIPPIVCEYKNFPDHFGFFLPLAGISTVKQIRESSFDIKATGRLNRLYVELLKDNPEWGTTERRHDMNHFMARLIFCFFAEDTEIFNEVGLFTNTVQQMSASDSSNTHEVIGEIFRAMNTTWSARGRAKLPRWADFFPYVNGGLFSGSTEVPRFSKIARAYLFNIGKLDWKKINPDIFGSMIQAVAEDEERGALGMHYTSVSNIRRVLNPLFLDDLRLQLEKAGNNQRILLNLRKRIAKIRVFDPACGSGNFLVIAYKDMREIEGEINKRRQEEHLKSEISLMNFRGIELRDFPSEVARLALIIAEYQCDVLYRGQKEALAEFLPLEAENWIVTGNALQTDWLKVCPVTSEEDVETYVCGNPPYIWANNQTAEQKLDILKLQAPFGTKFKGLDYVAGWIYKYTSYSRSVNCDAAFVATNSITQGEQVDPLWSKILEDKCIISFAHRSFKWQNLAMSNAGVSVVIVGLSRKISGQRRLYNDEECIQTSNISPYLLPMENIWVRSAYEPLNGLMPMLKGSQPTCGGGLILSSSEATEIIKSDSRAEQFIKNFIGSDEITTGKVRKCLWINDEDANQANEIQKIQERLQSVVQSRKKSKKIQTQEFAEYPHRFTERRRTDDVFIAVPCVSSEARHYLTPVYLTNDSVISNRCFGGYGVAIWYFAIISSTLHNRWCETTSGKLETRLNYSNTLTWNTFPIPKLTEQNKADLARCAEDILLARESHFPLPIGDLYDPELMPVDLLRAHERNDEVLERIYIGRRFKNDSERLEKLFDLYSKMVASTETTPKSKKKSKKKESPA